MSERFIARQPIFDQRLKVFAYELLFRSGPENRFRPGPAAADDVIVNSTMLFDMQSLVGHSMAFFNVDASALQREVPKLLSPKKVVLEILETVRPTPEVIESCASLVSEKYILALDDFLDEPKWQPLIPYVQFLKVDFRAASHDLRGKIADRYLPKGIHLVAEKVETEAELQEAKNLGYTYYQGFFFCRPAMISGREIPANRPICLQLLRAANEPELNYQLLEDLFRQDPSLTYRLLRYLNSPAMALRAEIHNIRHAVTMLGEREFRRWTAIVALVTMADNKPAELVKTALIRGYFCEALAVPLQLAEAAADLFLMGLLSAADAMLDRPLPQILSELRLAAEITAALTGNPSRFEAALKIARAYEAGDWDGMPALTNVLQCNESAIPECYRHAVTHTSSFVE